MDKNNGEYFLLEIAWKFSFPILFFYWNSTRYFSYKRFPSRLIKNTTETTLKSLKVLNDLNSEYSNANVDTFWVELQ